MKAICPISGVPFRTYDSLSIKWPVEHPIFSIPFLELTKLLEQIREQEEELIVSWNKDSSDRKKEAVEASKIKDLTLVASLAIHEKQWNNPAFKLYQTKHLVMLAFMQQATLLEVETGYAARPRPEIIDSHFWVAVDLFGWACTVSNPQYRERFPRYKISQDNEGMESLPEYIEMFNKIRDSIGNKYRSISTERKLAVWEEAITILNRRRDSLKQKLSTTSNPIAAKWALTITDAPKQFWDFWFAILSSPSTQITFEGVKVGDKMEMVTQGDLKELYDWLDDNLIRPKGEVGEYHRDDTEYYFMARQTVLNIVRTHILFLEQGSFNYRIVNSAVGDNVVSASDDKLEVLAISNGLPKKPSFIAYPKKIDLIRALAGWRTETRANLLKILEPESQKKEVEKTPYSKEEKGKYEIL